MASFLLGLRFNTACNLITFMQFDMRSLYYNAISAVQNRFENKAVLSAPVPTQSWMRPLSPSYNNWPSIFWRPFSRHPPKQRPSFSKKVKSKVSISPLRELTCHMGSHSVTCHPAEVTFPPLPQPKMVLGTGTSRERNTSASVTVTATVKIRILRICKYVALSNQPFVTVANSTQ